MLFCDSHIHAGNIPDWRPLCVNGKASPVCACAVTAESFTALRLLRQTYGNSVRAAFGVHPLNVDKNLLSLLKKALDENEIDAIGEAGFDFYTKESGKTERAQQQLWEAQCALAAYYRKPLVVHCRRATHKLFESSALLRTVPSVVFHSWPGSIEEARSLRSRGINAYFGIGKQVLNGNKRALRSATELPLEWLLLETDAPYQTLKGERVTDKGDIVRVYEAVARLRGIALTELCAAVYDNFTNAF